MLRIPPPKSCSALLMSGEGRGLVWIRSASHTLLSLIASELGWRLNLLLDLTDTTLVRTQPPSAQSAMREDQLPAWSAKTTQQGEPKCCLLLLGREWAIRSLISPANTTGLGSQSTAIGLFGVGWGFSVGVWPE